MVFTDSVEAVSQEPSPIAKDLPTMADLDRLEGELNELDAVLARMDASAEVARASSGGPTPGFSA